MVFVTDPILDAIGNRLNRRVEPAPNYDPQQEWRAGLDREIERRREREEEERRRREEERRRQEEEARRRAGEQARAQREAEMQARREQARRQQESLVNQREQARVQSEFAAGLGREGLTEDLPGVVARQNLSLATRQRHENLPSVNPLEKDLRYVSNLSDEEAQLQYGRQRQRESILGRAVQGIEPVISGNAMLDRLGVDTSGLPAPLRFATDVLAAPATLLSAGAGAWLGAAGPAGSAGLNAARAAAARAAGRSLATDVGAAGGGYGAYNLADRLGAPAPVAAGAAVLGGIGGGVAAYKATPAIGRAAGAVAKREFGNIPAGETRLATGEFGGGDFTPGQFKKNERVIHRDGTEWIVKGVNKSSKNNVDLESLPGQPRKTRVVGKDYIRHVEAPQPAERSLHELMRELGIPDDQRQVGAALENIVRSGRGTPEQVAQYTRLREMAIDAVDEVAGAPGTAAAVGPIRGKFLGSIDMTIKNPQPTLPLPGDDWADKALIGAGPGKGGISMDEWLAQTNQKRATNAAARAAQDAEHRAALARMSQSDPGRPDLSFADEALAGAGPVEGTYPAGPRPGPLMGRPRSDFWPNDPNRPNLTLGQEAEQLRLDFAGNKPPPPSGARPSGFIPDDSKPPLKSRVGAVALDILGLPRALRATLDLSAGGRQGAVLGSTEPKLWGRAFKQQLLALRSESKALELDSALRADPDFARAQRAGLGVTDIRKTAPLAAKEEAFATTISSRLGITRPSERAYVTFLNDLRFTTWKKRFNALDPMEQTDANARAIAKEINVASGRGEIPRWLEGQGAVVLNNTFFSPRYWASRLELLANPLVLRGRARKHAIIDLAVWTGEVTTTLALGNYFGVWDVNVNPNSPDFGKGKIGPARIDFWTGEQQLARTLYFLGQDAYHLIPDWGVLPDNERTNEGLPQLGRYVRGKLAPVPGEAVTQLAGEDAIGEPAGDWKRALENLAAPIGVSEVAQTAAKYGPFSKETAVSALGLFGVGANVYETRTEKNDRAAQELLGYDTYPAGHRLAGQRVSIKNIEPYQIQQLKESGKYEASDYSTAVEEYRKGTTATNLDAERKYRAGEISAAQLKDVHAKSKAQVRGFVDAMSKDFPDEVKDTPLGKLGALLDKHTVVVDGVKSTTADMDAVEAEMATWPQEDLDWLSRNTGLYATPMEKARIDAYRELDKIAKAQGASDWGGLEKHKRVEALNQNPKLAEAMLDEAYIARQKRQKAQEENDAAFRSGDITLGEWNTQRKRNNDMLAGAHDALYGGRAPSEIKNPLDRYYATIKEATTAGKVDWDRVDAAIAGMSAEDRAYIERNTGLYDTAIEKERRSAIKKLEADGYFTMPRLRRMRSGLSEKEIGDYRDEVENARAADPRLKRMDYRAAARRILRAQGLTAIQIRDVTNAGRTAYQNPAFAKYRAANRKLLIWLDPDVRYSNLQSLVA